MAARVEPIRTYRIPKRGGGERLMADLGPVDASRWRRLGERIAATVGPTLPPNVLANRTPDDLRGRSLRVELRRARTAASALGRAAPLVLRTDVAACYPSITPEVVARGLRHVDVDRADAGFAADLLEGWGSEGYAGLPIGPPASAVIANAILVLVDRALHDVTFLRWVDDYLVSVRSERDAGEVVDRLDTKLASIGLRRSIAKTELMEGGRPPHWLGTASGV